MPSVSFAATGAYAGGKISDEAPHIPSSGCDDLQSLRAAAAQAVRYRRTGHETYG